MLRPVLAGAVVVFLTITALVALTPSTAAAASTFPAIAFAPSSTTVGVAGVSFSYSFVPATSQNISAMTFTVPTGTSGKPRVSAASAWSGYAVDMGAPTASLSGTTLTVTFGNSPQLPAGAQVGITVAGLTNPPAATTAASTVRTFNGSTVVDQGTAAAVAWTAGGATAAFWSPSTTDAGATGVVMQYGLTTATAATLTSVSLVLPPGSTSTGSLTVTAVSPGAIAGGSASLSGQVLTYTFAATSVAVGTHLTVTVSGLTNPTEAGSYQSVIVTRAGQVSVDSASLPAVSYGATPLGAVSWSTGSTTTGATGVDYTVSITVGSAGFHQFSSIVMNLPPGTSGTPVLRSLSVTPSYFSPAVPTITRDGAQLTLSFDDTNLDSSDVILIEIAGLTNTPVAGAYPMPIALMDGSRAVNAAVAPAVIFTSTALTSTTWSLTSTVVSAPATSSSVGFGFSGNATLTAITVSVPPSTGGKPVVGAVTPTGLAGGSVSLNGQTLTYTLPAATSVTAGTVVSLRIDGLTNTPTPQTYAATITAFNGSVAVASGGTPTIAFTSAALTSLTWATSSAVAGADTAYTFGFTTATATTLSGFTMSVPSGTTGTPAVGTVTMYSPSQGTQTLGSASASLAGTTITVTFTSMYVADGTQVSIQLTGLTNTPAAGSYTSAVATRGVIGGSAGAINSGTTPALTLAAASLNAPDWSVSSTATGQQGVAYTFTAIPSGPMTVGAFRMSVPSDTTGTPSVGAVLPASIAGGTVSLAGGFLTYTFPATTLPAGTAISITIDNVKNTTTAGSYVSTITAMAADGAPVASGTAAALGFTDTVLTALSWTASATAAGASGVTYTFGFTTASAQALTGVQFALPAGTSGTPVLRAVSAQQAQQGTIVLSGTTVSLSGSVLTLGFSSVSVPSGAVFSVQVDGLTNADTAGAWATTIATRSGAHSVDSGTTPTLTFSPSYISLRPPAALRWAAAAVGGSAIVDTTAADQGYSVIDSTGTGAGWNVSVSATSFTDGTHTLPSTGTFTVNGSLTSSTATTPPAVACTTGTSGTCVLPQNGVSYPVPITTAETAPPAVRIFSAAKSTGSGAFTVGGSTSVAPIGWWVHLPATAYAGTYTSTITFSISAGP